VTIGPEELQGIIANQYHRPLRPQFSGSNHLVRTQHAQGVLVTPEFVTSGAGAYPAQIVKCIDTLLAVGPLDPELALLEINSNIGGGFLLGS